MSCSFAIEFQETDVLPEYVPDSVNIEKGFKLPFPMQQFDEVSDRKDTYDADRIEKLATLKFDRIRMGSGESLKDVRLIEESIEE